MKPEENQYQEIPLTQDEFEKFHNNFGSAYFKLQGEALEDFGTKKLDLYFKSVGFTSSVTGVIGIVAGFGFTAMDHVQSMFLFIVGEGLLLSALFHGMWWVQQIYTKEFNSINADIRKFRDSFNERNNKYMELYNGWMAKKSISKKSFQELSEMDKKSIDLFKTEEAEIPQTYSKITYFLGIYGSIVLLTSFFIFNLIYAVFCIF
jgi:hypothetical protein